KTMDSNCPKCKKPYDGVTCEYCTVTDLDVGGILGSDSALDLKNSENVNAPTAFLVDLVSNRKIPITVPTCKVGRDDLNDIVISGDQSISRFHFMITYEESQFRVQDNKSRHGTFLNGNQITAPEPINDGDVLKIGVSLFWFVIESQVAVTGDKPAPVDVENTVPPISNLTEGETRTQIPAYSSASQPQGTASAGSSFPEKNASESEKDDEMSKPESLKGALRFDEDDEKMTAEDLLASLNQSDMLTGESLAANDKEPMPEPIESKAE